MGSLALGALACASPASAGSPRQLNLPAGSLESALTALAAQTGDQLVYAPSMVAGRRVQALAGRYDAEGALARLLVSSEIVATRAGPKLIVLKQRAAAPMASVPPAEVKSSDTRPFEGDEVRVSATPVEAALPAEDTGERRDNTVDEVRVTGTHIRGGSPAAPVIALDRLMLENTGQATLAGALQSLPQNFAGEAAEGTVTTRADRLGTNASYGTSINLRGLGADATLVLINGRRMAGSGNRGDFADLSNIPMIAVQRVEVLLDGASALYGSDAVGGVVNVILRRDFEGGEIRVRGGIGEGGTPKEGVVAGVVGHRWESGSVLLAVEAGRREALAAADRAFSRSADLRPLGGTDQRDTFGLPGNITRVDPATGGTVPYWAIPAGQSGVGLKPSDFQAGVVNRYNQNQGVDLLPDQRRIGGYAAWRQQLTPTLELSGDARYGFRRAKVDGSGTISTLTVGRGNPFFVSPNGAATNQIQYAFSAEGGNVHGRVTAESLATTFGADLDLPRDWRLQSFAAFAQEIIESKQTGAVQALILGEALGNAPDNPATAYSPGRDGYFNPYAGAPGANSASTLAAILSGSAYSRYRSRVYSANAQADGGLLQTPGGEVKLAVGGQARRETFARSGANYLTQATFVPGQSVAAERTVASLFGELRVPVVGPANRMAGVETLDLSAALRLEHYSDFGRTLNPRLGVQWSPMAGVQVRGTYGESFRAPALTELGDPRTIASILLNEGAARVRVIALQGGNPDLDPETATSWTFGADLDPAFAPGLRISGTWFRTDFDQRIDRPLVTSRTTALTDPRLATFVQRTSPGTNPNDLAQINALLADPRSNITPGTFLPTDIGAIIDQRWVNTAGLRVSGIDVQVSYSRPLRGGRLALAANASRMLEYKQAITPAAPFDQLLGQVSYPAKFRGRLTADWLRDNMALGAAMNHLGSFSDPVAGRVGSQTTFDINARMTLGPSLGLGRATVTLNVRNLFDRAPPFYDNPAGYGFDPASADPVGRFVSIQLSRSW